MQYMNSAKVIKIFLHL